VIERIAVVLVLALAAPAGAQTSTPLLSDDLAQHRRTRIDGGDDALEEAMGGVGAGFSTHKLEPIEDRLRAEFARERQRATTRMVIFAYPGRVSAERLRAMTEIFVDVELVVDPCERSVCMEAVARHIEMVGRAIDKRVIATQDYRILFQRLLLQTATSMHDQEVGRFVVPISDCIAAAQTPGGGTRWLEERRRADVDYEPQVTARIERDARARRLSLAAVPAVRRRADVVEVALQLRVDRVRWQQQLVDALRVAGVALKQNPSTPLESWIDVDLEPELRGMKPRHFRSAGSSVALFIDERIDQRTLLASYVMEVQQGRDAPRQVRFDESEAAGVGGGGDTASSEENAAIAVLASNFPLLATCTRSELSRNSQFRGVTVSFDWLPVGRADRITPKEPALKNGGLARCLEQTIGGLIFPRFVGPTRTIEYPIRVE
jgi:hypothetical protein